ncbi:MAG: hypothetical protein IPF50_00910 [Proteobacteria bacterium]|nr:hypothetical protein [Pseudomonadota bacterium]MBP6107324.1 hypothetical protein [Steroidobacteraceae bacterium]MBP7014532.1 hypothetical protein [Steroidobacteraceae bacterium]
MEMTPAAANIKLTVLDSKAQTTDRLDSLVRFTNAGLPQELIHRLGELWDARQEMSGRVVHVGNIIFMEINRFIDENPNLAIGVALGAAVGALTAMIPGIGPLLAPFTMAAAVLIGALSGQDLDNEKGANGAIGQIAQDLINLARKFFELLASIFNALRTETA